MLIENKAGNEKRDLIGKHKIGNQNRNLIKSEIGDENKLVISKLRWKFEIIRFEISNMNFAYKFNIENKIALGLMIDVN